MLDGIQNHKIFIGENDVGISVHDLDEKIEVLVVAHLGLCIEFDLQNAVGVVDFDAFDACVGEIFAKKHAKIGRNHGACLFACREVYSRRAGVAGHHKASVFAFGAHEKTQLVRFGLLNLVYSRALQLFVQFFCKGTKCK